jgi:DNA-binding PadR family transcriptional regulator
MSPQTVLALTEFLHAPGDWKYGYDISRETGLKSGTLYPILVRLADRALLETRWEAPEAGRPPRHMYRLTATGVQLARQWAPSSARRSRVQPVFGGARS